jgi:3-oxoadipate enol-lactonase
MPFFELAPEIKLHYIDLNPAAKPVLLLHGLGANCESWQLQTLFLVEHGFRVLVPDVPGFGKSDPLGGGASVKRIAGSIGEWLSDLNVAPLTVVGISMGAAIGLELALDFPEYIDKMVLVSAFARLEIFNFKSWPYFLWRYFLLQVFGLGSQADAVARRVFPYPGQVEYRREFIRQICAADPKGYRAMMRALARFNVEKQLSKVKAPALIITGENDTTVLPESQAKLARLLPNASQVIIPNAGHAVSIDQPVLLNNHLIEFLSEYS